MGTIIGFGIGYILGLRDGQNGFAAKLRQAWSIIRSSHMLKTLLLRSPATLGQGMKRRMALLRSQVTKS